MEMVSKKAAALMRKLLDKPVLMPEWEIIKKKLVLDELQANGLAKIIGRPEIGRFVICPEQMNDVGAIEEVIERLMMLAMVGNKAGIRRVDLLAWAKDVGILVPEETLDDLVELGVLEMVGDVVKSEADGCAEGEKLVGELEEVEYCEKNGLPVEVPDAGKIMEDTPVETEPAEDEKAKEIEEKVEDPAVVRFR